MTPFSFPTHAAEITDPWLITVLERSGAMRGARVIGHSWEPLAEQGAPASASSRGVPQAGSGDRR